VRSRDPEAVVTASITELAKSWNERAHRHPLLPQAGLGGYMSCA